MPPENKPEPTSGADSLAIPAKDILENQPTAQLPSAEPVPNESTWRCVNKSVVGTSHVDDGKPCQDSSISEIVGNVLIVAVADGAGSAIHSEIGAEIATNTAVEIIRANINELGMNSLDKEFVRRFYSGVLARISSRV